MKLPSLAHLKTRANAFLHPEQVKMNPAYQGMIGYGDFPMPHMMPKNYAAYAKEGYRTDPSVYKSIAYITRNGAAIPPRLYTTDKLEDEIESHPILDRLKKPNNEQTGVAYRESVLGFLLLSGNSYQYVIRGMHAEPLELWPLQPNLIEIMSQKKKGIVGYRYEPAHPSGDQSLGYAPPDIGHMKYWCPDDLVYGLSPMEVAALSVDQQTGARKWNTALLQNNTRPPGAWVVPTALGFNERQTLEKQLKDKLAGYQNAGTPPVLDAGLTWQSMGLAPAQMDWLEGMGWNANQIASIYGLAPIIIGDTSSMTYDNVMQAEAFSYTEGIFPDLDKLYALWNWWLVPMYPDLKNSGACLGYDKKTVEAIAYLLRLQKESASKLAQTGFITGFMTINESRDLVGLKALPGGDRLKLGNSLVPIKELKKPEIISVTAAGFSEQNENADPTTSNPLLGPGGTGGSSPPPVLPPGSAPPALPAGPGDEHAGVKQSEQKNDYQRFMEVALR